MTPATDPPIKDRYPGLNSFRVDEQAVFYGRTREITELLRLVRAEQMVTLFSKSGLGKSSLLSAGLFPQLTELGMQPIRIRMQQEKTTPDAAGSKSPIAIVTDAYRQQVGLACKQANIDQPTATASYAADKARLWDQIKAFPLPNGAIPVLVFDQFEEFLAFPPTDQKEFASQLAELMHDQAPARVINALLDLSPEKQTPEAIAWSQQPALKCVFAIRSDRLAEMHSLKAYIPLILRNRFELGPLTKANAQEAIEKPARHKQHAGPFLTADFTYQADVMNDILAALTEKKDADKHEERDEVEGSQLQIVCQFVESRQREEFTPVVDRSVIGNRDQIRRILVKFYRAQLAKAGDAADQAAAASVLENELIEGGRRVGLSKLRMLRLLGPFDEDHKRLIIKRLQDARLIRSETTQLGETYELSHDTLIEPIEKSRKIRLAWQQRRFLREEAVRRDQETQAERQRKDRELREQAAQLKKETQDKEAAIKLKDRLVRLSTAMIGLSVLIIGVAIWAWRTENQKRLLNKGLTNLTAAYQYKLGKHYEAYALWNQIDSTDKHLFAPYAGKDIQADTNRRYVASLYDDGLIEVRQQRDEDRDLIIYRTNAADFNLAGSALAIYQANTTKDTGASTYSVQFTDLVTQQPLLPNSLPVSYLQAVSQSNDGQYAVVLDSKRHAHLYQLTGQSAREIVSFDQMLTQDGAGLYPGSFRVAFNKGATHLIVRDGSYRIWLYDLRQQAKRFGPVSTKAYRFSGDGTTLASVHKRWLLVYDLADSSGRADTTELRLAREFVVQLTFTPANESALLVTDDPKQLTVINLTTKQQAVSRVVVVGRSHALFRRGNHPKLRSLVRNTFINCPLPTLERNLDMVFYAPDGRTDTHLIALYRDRVQIIDLRTKQEKTIQQKGKPFSQLSLTGNLLRIQLGERNQENQTTAEYLSFFIDAARNEPAFLGESVYPEQTENQRDKYGFAK